MHDDGLIHITVPASSGRVVAPPGVVIHRNPKARQYLGATAKSRTVALCELGWVSRSSSYAPRRRQF